MKPKSKLRTFILACSSLLAISSLHAADGTWTQTPAGPFDWDDIANWNSGAGPIADTADSTANFTANINPAQTVNLNNPKFIGNITFTDSTTSSHDLTISGANILTLDRTDATKPTINVTQSGRILTVSSVIAGGDGLLKTGGGEFAPRGLNTFTGGVDLAGGRITITDNANEQSFLGDAANVLTFTGNAELLNTNNPVTLPQGITISGGFTGTVSGAFGESTVVNGVLDGSGTLVVQGYSAGYFAEFRNTANTFTGPIRIQSGDSVRASFRSLLDSAGATTIGLQSNGDLGGNFEYMSGAITPLVLTNRQFELITNGNSGSNEGRQAAISSNAAGSNTITINSDLLITGTGNKLLQLKGGNGGDNTFEGVIPDSAGADKFTLYKFDGGKWILSGANTYQGDTIIRDGILEIRGDGQLGAGGVYPGNITSTDTTPSPFTFDSTANSTLGGVISGPMSLVKDGAGTLTITGSATQTGGTTVAEGTLSLGNGTNSASLGDFATLSIDTGAVANLNYTGADSVFFLNLGGSPVAAGTWGATGSGATNINDTFFTGTGVINNLNGDSTSIGIAFWDGGVVNIGGNGNAASAGTNGTWDTSIQNWDYGVVAHAAWLNTTSATATFGGTAGTVTLGADMNIGNLTVNLTSAGGSGYSIGASPEDNTLTFGGAKTVTAIATGTGTNQDLTIRAGIAGSPTMDIAGRATNTVDQLSLLPGAAVTQTIGTLNMLNTFASNKRLILGGASTGNVVDTVTWSVTANQLALTKAGAGSWTINNNLAFSTNRASRLYVEQGTLTLGGTNNSTTHKVGIGSVRESTFTASGTASKLIAKGTFTINDNREYFFVQNLATLSPGPGVGTLTVTWLTNSGGTHGQFNMQTGSTYEWGVASAASTDVVNVQRGGSSSGSLTLGNMTIKVNDAGVATPIAAGDQLPVFTYQSGVTRSIGTITIDTSGLGVGWGGTPSLVDNGTGTIYITGLTFSAAATYTVTYDGNGSTGGTVPVDGNTYAMGATVTVLGNSGSLVKAGSVFTGWNTQADGMGTHYNPAATFSMGSANVTLFAEWITLYDDWAAGFTPNPGTLLLNPDGDLFTNQLEFAFGTDPNVLDNSPLSWAGGMALAVPGAPTVEVDFPGGGGVNFTARFMRRKDHGTTGSLSYAWEFSSNLTDWEASDDVSPPSWLEAPTDLADDASGDYDLVEVPYPFILDSGKKARYFRVSVTAL